VRVFTHEVAPRRQGRRRHCLEGATGTRRESAPRSLPRREDDAHRDAGPAPGPVRARLLDRRLLSRGARSSSLNGLGSGCQSVVRTARRGPRTRCRHHDLEPEFCFRPPDSEVLPDYPVKRTLPERWCDLRNGCPDRLEESVLVIWRYFRIARAWGSHGFWNAVVLRGLSRCPVESIRIGRRTARQEPEMLFSPSKDEAVLRCSSARRPLGRCSANRLADRSETLRRWQASPSSS